MTSVKLLEKQQLIFVMCVIFIVILLNMRMNVCFSFLKAQIESFRYLGVIHLFAKDHHPVNVTNSVQTLNMLLTKLSKFGSATFLLAGYGVTHLINKLVK